MKLAAEISVPLQVRDFVEAGEHQRQLEEFLDLIRARYPDATLTVRERRQRIKSQPSPTAGRRFATGALHQYDE
ncbi:hypothetical protein [Phenylobacterium sp.]|uniref:hypothetical protein n=1 Tax=Phenylobacterium sp. TaxID=1871053 RepID=UPI002C3E3665|nr:hypothetical protein [Phenylobacterium sp.]HLZ74085.1 hypothetical protein [Phenylobacterium sp.]